MAIGRPISLTPNIATKNISSVATANQTEFTVTGGYRINEIAVYRNGVRLAQGRDFTASDGDTVTLTNGATVSDVIEFSVFDSFNVAGTIVSAASSQDVSGDLNVTGKLYGGTVDTDSLKIGVGTFASAIHVGTALTVDASGNFNTVGMITAASFSGSGANLTGVASTDNIITGTAATFRNTAVSAGVPNVNIVGLATVGIITAYGAAELSSTVAVGGVVTLTDTTDATSTSTGALIISGGVGIAKSLHVGQNISVGGTLTYEDVTNVDSIGLVTARSGVNVSGGQLTVGSGITMGIAGVATFSGTSDVHLLDNVRLNIGDGSDLAIYHDGSHSYISDQGTGNLRILTSSVFTVNNAANSENMILATDGGSVDLYYNANKKFETTNDGTVTTGIGTFTEGLRLADSKKLILGTSDDLQIYTDGSNSAILHNGDGDLLLLAEGSGEDIKLKAAENVDLYVNTTEIALHCDKDGAVQLRHNNNTKLETSSGGISVTGSVTATNYLGDGSALTGIGGDMDITSSLFV